MIYLQNFTSCFISQVLMQGLDPYTLSSLLGPQRPGNRWDNYFLLIFNEVLREFGPSGHGSHCKYLFLIPPNILLCTEGSGNEFCFSLTQDLPIFPILSKPYNKEEHWLVPQRWRKLAVNSTNFFQVKLEHIYRTGEYIYEVNLYV